MWVDVAIHTVELTRADLSTADSVVVRVGLLIAGALAAGHAARLALAWGLIAVSRLGPRSPRSRWSRRLTEVSLRVAPRGARRRLVRWSGVAVTTGVMVAAATQVASAAAETAPSPPGSPSSTWSTVPAEKVPAPDLDRGRIRQTPPPPPPPPHGAVGVSGAVGVPGADVLVRRGDTLWDIAASQLPRGCTNAQIAAAWPRWYRHNRRVIGPNPHLIIPGMRLLPPARIEAVTR